MRRVIYMVFCLIFSLNCFAQKNEIGVHLFGYSPYLFNSRSTAILFSEGQYSFKLLNGITYKRQIDEENALRASFYNRKLTSILPKRGYPFGTSGTFSEHSLKLGYERALNTKRFSPYAGADVSFFLSNYKGFSYGDFATLDFDIAGKGIGISPFFGLRFNVTERLSLSAESCADFVLFTYNHRDVTHIFNGSNNEKLDFYTANHTELRFNPLQKLSLNVRF